MQKKPQINVKALVTFFGGRVRIPGALREQELVKRITPYTVDKWLQRGRIPSDMLAALMVLAQRERRPIDLNKFIVFKEPKK